MDLVTPARSGENSWFQRKVNRRSRNVRSRPNFKLSGAVVLNHRMVRGDLRENKLVPQDPSILLKEWPVLARDNFVRTFSNQYV